MLVQSYKEGVDFQHPFKTVRVTLGDGSVGDLVVGSSEGVVHSFVDSVVGLFVGSVAREIEDDTSTTTEVLLGKTAVTTDVAPGVALLITAEEDEKM